MAVICSHKFKLTLKVTQNFNIGGINDDRNVILEWTIPLRNKKIHYTKHVINKYKCTHSSRVYHLRLNLYSLWLNRVWFFKCLFPTELESESTHLIAQVFRAVLHTIGREEHSDGGYEQRSAQGGAHAPQIRHERVHLQATGL